MRNILVGDKLNNENLTMDFSDLTLNSFAGIGDDIYPIIVTNNGRIECYSVNGGYAIDVLYNSASTSLFVINSNGNVSVNKTSYVLPEDFGTVQSINSNLVGYNEITFDGGHEKVYAICENMCIEETMTKEQIEALCNKVVVISGQIHWSSSTQVGEATVNYPNGFNSDNTKVLSISSDDYGNLIQLGSGILGFNVSKSSATILISLLKLNGTVNVSDDIDFEMVLMRVD